MNIKANYINIRWKNKDEIEEVKEHYLSEKLEYIDENTYFLQLYTYVKIDNLFAQIAFQIDDDTIIPVILLSDGSKQELKRIIDPVTNKVWWIENGEWSPKGKFYEAQLINHIGNTKIYFGDIVVDINVKSLSLTEEDIGIMLDDFKDELWRLIYSKKSYSSIKMKSGSIFTINKNYIELLEEYLQQITKFLLKPKSRLDDIFIREKFKKIKPTHKTFIEYMNNPTNKYYTSKSKQDNYDIAENRYIYYTYLFINNLISYNIKYQTYLYDSSSNKINNIQQHVSKLNSILTTKEMKVDKNIFLKDLENKKMIYEKIINISCEENKNINTKKYEFRIIKIEPVMIKYYEEEYEEEFFYYHAKLINDNDNKTYRLRHNQFDGIFTNDCLGIFEIECVLTKITNVYSFYNYYVPKVDKYKIMSYKTVDYINYTVQNDQENILQNIDITIIKQKQVTKNYIVYKFMFTSDLKSNLKLTNIISQNYYSIYIPCDNTDLINNIKKNGVGNTRLKISIYQNMIQESSAYELSDIINIVPITLKEKIKSLEQKRNIYEANNWIRKFSPKENKQDYNTLKYLEQQKIYSNQKFIMESKRIQSYINTDVLVKIQKKLLQLHDKFKKLNLSSSHIFPNSMVFVQNPIYSKIYKVYKSLLEIQNIDNDILLLLDVTENRITIVDIPHVYEKWCLIVLINTFIYSFGFKPVKADWLKQLANSLFNNRAKNVSIDFTNKSLGYDVKIWYEKELSSKKIPDIVLEIKHVQLHSPYIVVVDAKFHENAKIINLIKLLYSEKNYSENGKNSVFIFHPDRNAMEKENIIVNQQVWGKGSFLGEGILYNINNQLNYANHQYGAVCITPQDYNYLLMAQRFVGMCLQYYTYTNAGFKPSIWLCIACGHANSNNVSCEKCGNYVVYSHCYNCRSKIIKNGHFWSYHKYVIDDPFNIDCPNCGHNLLDYYNSDIINNFYPRKS